METQFFVSNCKIINNDENETRGLTVYNGVLWQAKGAARGRGKAGSVNIVE